ncbi:MAG: MFS transporter [Acidimicrobiia bacterium]|nr:MFS transporter [Acidimicrobiia bacterium]
MHVPTRIVFGGRSGAPFALIASTAATTVMFAATPFLIAPIASRYGVGEGTVGLISVVQVGAFAIVNFVFPRLVRPSGRLLRLAALILLVFNTLSVVVTVFPILLVLRFVAGAAAGVATWLAWTSAMQHATALPSIAATGPVTALVAAPALSVLSEHGDRAVYLALAVVTIPAVVFVAPVPGRRRRRGVISASRSNRILLLALAGLTFFGSSLYINESIVARDIHGLTPLAASVAFSLNALGGLIGARLSTRHRIPGWFAASIGLGALVTVVGPTPMFYVGLFWWGFAFWMAVPGVLQMLVDRSLEPTERAGDGQGVMAVGRSLGPALGGVFVDQGALVPLAVVAATGIALSGATVVAVKEGRERLPPSDPGTLDQQ